MEVVDQGEKGEGVGETEDVELLLWEVDFLCYRVVVAGPFIFLSFYLRICPGIHSSASPLHTAILQAVLGPWCHKAGIVLKLIRISLLFIENCEVLTKQ